MWWGSAGPLRRSGSRCSRRRSASIRRLPTGERVDHHGTHYVVEDARLYTLPERPVPILVSGLGAKAIELAARAGDGLITTKPEKADVDKYIVNGGRGPVEAGVKVCWGDSEDEAAKLAIRNRTK